MPSRSVSTMNVTTASPVRAPMTSASARKIWSSRCCNQAERCSSGVRHQLFWFVAMRGHKNKVAELEIEQDRDMRGQPFSVLGSPFSVLTRTQNAERRTQDGERRT